MPLGKGKRKYLFLWSVLSNQILGVNSTRYITTWHQLSGGPRAVYIKKQTQVDTSDPKQTCDLPNEGLKQEGASHLHCHSPNSV